MHKTPALQTATQAVGHPMGRGTSWRFYAPYHSSKLDGPTTEHHASSHAAAVRRRTECVVDIAFELLGHKGCIVWPELADVRGSAAHLLDLVLSDLNRFTANLEN